MKPQSAPVPRSSPLKVLVTGVSSDAHTWNLVFLQKFVEEAGHQVVNLGPCVPAGLLVATCLRHRPDLVVVSSVNGHGLTDGLQSITALRAATALAGLPVVIGGKLTTSGALTTDQLELLAEAGFNGVFDESSLAPFRALLTSGRASLHAVTSIPASA